MKTHSLLFVFAAFAAVSSSSFAFTFEVAPNAEVIVQTVDPSPSPTPAPNENFLGGGVGLIGTQRSGNGPNQGVAAQAGIFAHGGHGGAGGPMLFFVRTFVHAGSGLKPTKADLGVGFSGFAGYSFNRDQDGLDFYVGGTGNLNANTSVSPTVGGNAQGYIGPEAGLHLRKKGVTFTVGGSVNIGGESCTGTMEDGSEIEFTTGAVGYTGIARLILRDNLYIDVAYTKRNGVPFNDQDSKIYHRLDGSTLDGALFLTLGKKLMLSGRCVINSMGTMEEQWINRETGRRVGSYSPGRDPVDEVQKVQILKNNMFQIGIIRKF